MADLDHLRSKHVHLGEIIVQESMSEQKLPRLHSQDGTMQRALG